MRIVLTSSEAVPFSKTGGLADVAGALTKALAWLGHDVTLIVPNYPQVQARQLAGTGVEVKPIGKGVYIPMNNRIVEGRILRSTLPGCPAQVYLIDQPNYFDRPGLYQDRDRDYRDNCERFSFFSRAVMETIRELNLAPDVIHCNDWQTGLIPALLRAEYAHRPGFERTASVFTIHNMAFQGQFWHWDMLLTGLDWKYFNWHQMEFFGNLNLLKTGIVFADMLTTVSPTYAREILTPEYGCGLNGVLHGRAGDLVGILNGCDTSVWNPAIDPHLPQRFDADTAIQGKAVCKAHLQAELGLPVRPEVPLLATVSRMTGQKGFDLVAECSSELLKLDLQYVLVGSGDPVYETMIKRFAAEHPTKVAAKIGYDEPLSHRVEAGADLYIMPSLFEPCGLNQMYSLIYGTVPLVRSTGGLADSVVDANEHHLANETANGFSFHEYRSDALLRTICRALGLYLDKHCWHQLMRTGMRRDWSWQRSAVEYVQLYHRAQYKRLSAPPF